MATTAQEVYRAISRILGASTPPTTQREALLALRSSVSHERTRAPSDAADDAHEVARAFEDALGLLDRRIALLDETARARQGLAVTHAIATAVAVGTTDPGALAARIAEVLACEVRIFARGASSDDPLVRWVAHLRVSAAYNDLDPQAELGPRVDERGVATRSALVALGAHLGLVLASDEPRRFGDAHLRLAQRWVALLERGLTPRDAPSSPTSLAMSILEALDLGIVVLGPRARPLVVNRTAAHLLAARPSELITRAGALPPLLTTTLGHDEGILIRENGKPVAVSVSRTQLAPDRALVTISPLSHGRHELAQWHFLGTHDPLTGLLNRHGLERALGTLTGRKVAVLYLDLDQFKAHNDRYGHLAGDRIIVALARRIGLAATSHDLVARIGGDEFVIVHPLGRPVDLRRFATRLRAQLVAGSVTLGGRQLGISVSVGAAVETAVPDLDRLLAAADRAMYVAKHTGSKVEIFSQRMAEPTPSGLLESDAFDALASGDHAAVVPRAFLLEDLATEAPRGAELTLAWARPRQVSPRLLARERHLSAAYNDLLLEALARHLETWGCVAVAPLNPDPRLVARINRIRRRAGTAQIVLIIEAAELDEPTWFDDAARASRTARATGLTVAVRWNVRVGGEIAQLARIRPSVAWLELKRYPRGSPRFLEGLCRLATTLGMQVVLADRPTRPRIERARLVALLPDALIVQPGALAPGWGEPT